MALLTKNVFRHRTAAMQALMDRSHLDALVFQAADSVEFASHLYMSMQTWERPIFAVVPRNGEPFMVLPEILTNHVRNARAADTIWYRDVHFYAEHVRVTDRIPLILQLPEMVTALLREAGLAQARIGVESKDGILTRVAGMLPGATLLAVGGEMRELRWVKTDEELAQHRGAAEISDWAQERYRENIRPGRLVRELDHAIGGMIAEEAARRYPGERVESKCITMTGLGSATPGGGGSSLNDVRFAQGDGIINICNIRLNGMWTENERTFFVGKPSNRQVELYEIARAASEAGCEAAVAGNPVQAIDGAAQRVIEQAGYAEYLLHRTGHGMGIKGHEYPEDMSFCFRKLKANEVFSVEPGIYLPDLGGFRIDDTVVIREGKPEIITRSARDIQSNTLAT